MIDFDFIKELEGFELEGYVPRDKKGEVLGHSGVTIASGFDLGQHSINDLVGMGFSDEMCNKLCHYLGKKRGEAVKLLECMPLKLTEEECDEINSKVKRRFINNIAIKYNLASEASFQLLPEEFRTVIVSVLFQYGSERKVPNFWKQVIECRWEDALANLRNFGDSYPTRRNREADLLEGALANER